MQLGSIVTLTYKGTLDDGTVFGYADVDNPMEFQTGMDLAIDGLEAKVLELEKAGDKAQFVVSCYDAYGEYLEDNFQTLAIESLPFRTPKVGQRLWMWGEDGGKIPATVTEIDAKLSQVTVDMNHPLAGKNLNFEIEILNVEPAPEGFVPASVRKKEQERLSGVLGTGIGGGAQ